MQNLGRPICLSRSNVSEVCMDIYWELGINNISYNDVIKISKLSKGSFYKLFNNEDDLQAETLDTYIKNVNALFDKLKDAKDLFQMLIVFRDWKFKNNLNYCYFFVSYLDKYRMGEKTKNRINKIELQYKLMLDKISRKHVEKHNLNKSNINIKQLVNFIFNSIALISLLYRNNSEKSNISLYQYSLYQFVQNLS